MPINLSVSPPDDPKLTSAQRQLRWQQFEKRLLDIEHQLSLSVKYGPVPGRAAQEIFGQTIRAAQIYSLDTVGTAPPVPRTQVGYLAAYTDPSGISSPVGDGVRVLDASGNIIFDSIGISGVGASLGVSSQAPGQTISNTAYAVTTPAIKITFTLARQIRCRFDALLQAHPNAGGAVLCYSRVAVYTNPGGGLVASTGDFKYQGTNLQGVSYQLLTGVGSVSAIGPGTYDAQVEVKVDAANTAYIDQGYIIGTQMGG